MNDVEALKELKNMGETDLLNLYYGYYSMDEANTYMAQENVRLRAENVRLRTELAAAREAFSWVEQHVTSIYVGFTNENPVFVNWIDDNGNDRESRCEALLDLVQDQLRSSDES